MSVTELSHRPLRKFRELLPGEYISDIREDRVKALGAYFAEEPAGVLLYEDRTVEKTVTEEDPENRPEGRGEGDTVSVPVMELRCLYVAPEFRRLGVATELMDALPEGRLTFTYEATDDRVTLEPFFDAVDVETERLDIPFGEFYVVDAIEELEQKYPHGEETDAVFYEALTMGQSKVVEGWMESSFGARGLYDQVYDRRCMFLLAEDAVKAALIIREVEPSEFDVLSLDEGEEPEKTFFLDYLFCEPGQLKQLPGMMKKMAERLYNDQGANARMQAFLMNREGQKLYASLFGDPEIEIPLIVRGA